MNAFDCACSILSLSSSSSSSRLFLLLVVLCLVYNRVGWSIVYLSCLFRFMIHRKRRHRRQLVASWIPVLIRCDTKDQMNRTIEAVDGQFWHEQTTPHIDWRQRTRKPDDLRYLSDRRCFASCLRVLLYSTSSALSMGQVVSLRTISSSTNSCLVFLSSCANVTNVWLASSSRLNISKF